MAVVNIGSNTTCILDIVGECTVHVVTEANYPIKHECTE